MNGVMLNERKSEFMMPISQRKLCVHYSVYIIQNSHVLLP